MNTKIISILIGVILIAGIGGVVYFQKYKETEPKTEQMEQNETSTEMESTNPSVTETSSTPTTPAVTTSSGITASTVATHNSRTSCWSSINGNVYDLTSWIPNHPGGEKAILQLCGIDGSEKFNGKHGGAPKQAAILAGFKIGTLSQ